MVAVFWGPFLYIASIAQGSGFTQVKGARSEYDVQLS